MIVGFLKTRFGINEVLSMIMFNWIAFYLSNYIADLDVIHSTGSAEATKNVADAAMILLPKGLIDGLSLAPKANWGIFPGDHRHGPSSTSSSTRRPRATSSRRWLQPLRGGIRRHQRQPLDPARAGNLRRAGGHRGATQLLGQGGRISIFTAQENFGFQGISVALIGASNPVGVFFAGLFYGALKYGGTKLNLIQAPSEVIDIITGTVRVLHRDFAHLPHSREKGRAATWIT